MITYLREAYRAGVLDTDRTRQQRTHFLKQQYERWWNTDIKRFRNKKQFGPCASVTPHTFRVRRSLSIDLQVGRVRSKIPGQLQVPLEVDI